MTMPVVGITTYCERVDRGDWSGQRSAVLPQNYVDKIVAAGAAVVLLPPRLDADDAVADALLNRLDGLVIAGGADVEASRYGAIPVEAAQRPRRDRDAFELALAARAVARDLPVLGICRGMQILAVAAGGVLEQHVPHRTHTTVHSPHLGRYSTHPVQPVPGTRLAGILGTSPVVVSTYHHQSVLTHPGYTPSAWHKDGTLEGMEAVDARFRLAVQWHPEQDADPRLFDAFVSACRMQIPPRAYQASVGLAHE